ncbi:uncharacterized protein C8R40DRAFT_1167034 [Lentinula edodes]|uniref:uncharacterized protein n=1 Tax=Lentinula edodes TaxID=5353 RepID=UPI001E8E6EB5|nr:uncharacterized protein C8R40DRAFT_1167034 [Lentinula edodes]KAH7879078.1 hypothetical protein C8R40DRAFT_1167034 [Lentinula edodes]
MTTALAKPPPLAKATTLIYWAYEVLSLATPDQRKILDENYGVKPTREETEFAKKIAEGKNGEEQGYLGEAERRVKAVFEEIGLREIYAEYEKNAYKKLTGMIDQIDEGTSVGLKKEVFKSFLDKIHHRQK